MNDIATNSQAGRAGHFTPMSSEGGTYSTFSPKPLPPDPPLAIDTEMQRLLDRANQALGRLDGITLLLPDADQFLYSYIRKEAVLSSQIEGTQSSLSDLLLFEHDVAPGVPEEDVRETTNYLAALNLGLRTMEEGLASQPPPPQTGSWRAPARHSRRRDWPRRVPPHSELARVDPSPPRLATSLRPPTRCRPRWPTSRSSCTASPWPCPS